MVVAIETDPALIGTGWNVDGVGAIEVLDWGVAPSVPAQRQGVLDFVATVEVNGESQLVWRGRQDLLGNITAVGQDRIVRRGFAAEMTLSDLLSHRPPTIYFLNGTTVHGTNEYESRTAPIRMPQVSFVPYEWPATNLRAETRTVAARSRGGRSVHETLEEYLRLAPRHGRHRWIIGNDGQGEFADYIVVESFSAADPVRLTLWHAKAAGGNPGVRVTDLQEAIAQAIKSRRWLTDVRLWSELGARLVGESSPRAHVIDGRQRVLQVLCGRDPRFMRLSYVVRQPRVVGEVAIAQPGLSFAQFQQAILAGEAQSLVARQVRDLLAVLRDSVSLVAAQVTVLCSA